MLTSSRRPATLLKATVLSTAVLAAAGCSGPATPSLDEAIAAAHELVANESYLDEVLITPHAGRGSATFDIPSTDAQRTVKISCLGEGELTVRVDGEERSSGRCDNGTVGIGLGGVDGDGNVVGTDVERQVELHSTDDLYWVATAFTTTR